MSDDVISRGAPWNGRSNIPGTLSLWGLSLVFGVVTLGLGVTLAVWPRSSLGVIAVLIAVQVLVTGALRIVMAILPIDLHIGDRILLTVTGALALIVGLLCLRDPLQTMLALSIILGAWWMVSGIVDIARAILTERGATRGLSIIRAGLTTLMGGLLLVSPQLSLGLLVLVVSVWLIVIGILSIAGAVQLRSSRSAGGAPELQPSSPASAS